MIDDDDGDFVDDDHGDDSRTIVNISEVRQIQI